MSLLALSGTNSVSGGYDIDNSLKLEADNSEYMDRVITTQGNQKTFTISAWVKRTEVNSSVDGFGHTFFFGGAYGNEAVILRFNTGTTSNVDALQIGIGIGTTQNRSYTQRKFRDTSAWYHIVLAVDTTQATATDRFKLYVNGVLETEYASRNNPAQNLDTGNNKAQSSTYLNNVGSYKSAGTVYGKFCGYIAEVYNIDGSALAPTDFGEFDNDSGIWKPKEYTGSFPNNSFYLDFQDSSDLGAQAKGDDRNFTTYNITAADQAVDTPTNNFCTLNPLMTNTGNFLAITEGATRATNTVTAYKTAASTIGLSSGKWYWEVKLTNMNTITAMGVTMPYYWDGDFSFGGCVYYGQPAQRYNNSSASFYGATYATGDIIGFALDMDATTPTMTCYKNGVSQGNLFENLSINGAGGAFLPPKEDFYFAKLVAYNTNVFDCNFGGYTAFTISSAASDDNGYGTFEYAPPSGYYAICTKNLAEYG